MKTIVFPSNDISRLRFSPSFLFKFLNIKNHYNLIQWNFELFHAEYLVRFWSGSKKFVGEINYDKNKTSGYKRQRLLLEQEKNKLEKNWIINEAIKSI